MVTLWLVVSGHSCSSLLSLSSEHLRDYCFAIQFLSFLLSLPAITRLLTLISKESCITLGVILVAVSLYVLAFRQQDMLSTGLALSGVGGALFMVPVLPQLIEYMQTIYP